MKLTDECKFNFDCSTSIQHSKCDGEFCACNHENGYIEKSKKCVKGKYDLIIIHAMYIYLFILEIKS